MRRAAVCVDCGSGSLLLLWAEICFYRLTDMLMWLWPWGAGGGGTGQGRGAGGGQWWCPWHGAGLQWCLCGLCFFRRVSLRPVVVVARGCLSNGGQQGCHSYKDEFFHDCDENYVKVIKMFRFYNLSVEGTRILCKIYTIFYFFSVRR